MLNFRIQEQSVVASLEGTRLINSKISDLVKKEIIDFIEKSGKQVILDLKGVSFSNEQGLSALKAIVELARANERLFTAVKNSDNAIEDLKLNQLYDSVTLGKN
jgi:anti-anti-sigma regulatory factor